MRQIWCVYRAPKPKPLPPPAAATTTSTSTFVSASDPQTNGTSSWFTVTGSIYYGGGSELLGQPLTYTILDATTGQQVGSFSGTSNSDGQCSVVYGLTAESTLQTWTGQAVAPYPACSLGTVSMPAGDTAVFTGAFAGNAKFAASTSGEAGFY